MKTIRYICDICGEPISEGDSDFYCADGKRKEIEK
jgi:hypothetical protein